MQMLWAAQPYAQSALGEEPIEGNALVVHAVEQSPALTTLSIQIKCAAGPPCIRFSLARAVVRLRRPLQVSFVKDVDDVLRQRHAESVSRTPCRLGRQRLEALCVSFRLLKIRYDRSTRLFGSAISALASVGQVQQCRLPKLDENLVPNRIGSTLVHGGAKRIEGDAAVQGQVDQLP